MILFFIFWTLKMPLIDNNGSTLSRSFLYFFPYLILTRQLLLHPVDKTWRRLMIDKRSWNTFKNVIYIYIYIYKKCDKNERINRKRGDVLYVLCTKVFVLILSRDIWKRVYICMYVYIYRICMCKYIHTYLYIYTYILAVADFCYT